MSSKEEQVAILDEAESKIESGDANGAMDLLAKVDHEDLQSRKDFLMSQTMANNGK